MAIRKIHSRSITDSGIAAVDIEDNLVLSGTDAVTLPSGTTAQRGSGVAGKFRYNTDDNQFEGYADGSWGSIGGSGGATGGGSDAIFYENGQTITTDYTITSSTNAVSTGPITVNSGITVTVPSGSRWVVL